MRKIVLVLLGCLVLSGCGAAEWEQEVEFEVVKVYEVGAGYDRKDDTLRMELVGEVPDDILEPDTLTPQVVKRFQVSGEVREGDEVSCSARQKTDGYTQATVIRTHVSCRKA